MQRVQQWDLTKEKHIYSLQALKVFHSMCLTTELIESTQAVLPTLFHPLLNTLLKIIIKCCHNITFNIDNNKLAASSWSEGKPNTKIGML